MISDNDLGLSEHPVGVILYVCCSGFPVRSDRRRPSRTLSKRRRSRCFRFDPRCVTSAGEGVFGVGAFGAPAPQLGTGEPPFRSPAETAARLKDWLTGTFRPLQSLSRRRRPS